MKKIVESDWKWYGFPGHFICTYMCDFRLCTQVGDYLISTVGGMHNEGEDWKDVGLGRKFETMVFKVGEMCRAEGCNCGKPEIDGSELDMLGCNTPGEAQANHIKLCQKYSGCLLPDAEEER